MSIKETDKEMVLSHEFIGCGINLGLFHKWPQYLDRFVLQLLPPLVDLAFGSVRSMALFSQFQVLV